MVGRWLRIGNRMVNLDGVIAIEKRAGHKPDARDPKLIFLYEHGPIVEVPDSNDDTISGAYEALFDHLIPIETREGIHAE
jgi:hypothetical protein